MVTDTPIQKDSHTVLSQCTYVTRVLHVVHNAQVLYIMQYVWSDFTDRMMCLYEREWISMHSCSCFPSSASQSPSGPH